MSLGLLVSSLPWWIAAPLLQIAVLVFGMALDETYVNRTTVLTGSIAVHLHIFVAGDVGVLVALYADLGLLIGFYGLYTYVTDRYVGNWFRLLAYFVYSPLSVFLVILAAGPTVFGIEPLVIPALALAGFANIQFREYLQPREPYYFGPRSQEVFEAVVEAEATASAPTETRNVTPESATPGGGAESEPTATAPETGTAATADTAAETTANSDPKAGTEASAGETTAATTQQTDTDSFNEPEVTDDSADLDHPAAEPAAAADSSERGILPEFMRRL